MSDIQMVEGGEVKSPSEAKSLPTRESLRESGWSARDLDAAEKYGMIEKSKKKSEEDVNESTEVTKEVVEEKQTEQKKEESKSDKVVNSLPDFSMTPEQEEEFAKIFPKGTAPRGLYFRMKNERRERQNAQAELARERAAREALEARLKALESVQVTKNVNEDGTLVVDEDPDNRPLTLKQWKEFREAEDRELAQKRSENDQRARLVSEAQATQEEYVRSLRPDFDQTLELAADLMKNIDSLLPEKWQQTKALKLIRDLQIATAQADKIDLDEYHGPWIAYELGQLHPNYGKSNGQVPTETGDKKNPKKDGVLTPEQMKRIEKNTQRGIPSASIPGGGVKRSISADEVTAEDFNRKTYKERQAFRTQFPEQYARIMRG